MILRPVASFEHILKITNCEAFVAGRSDGYVLLGVRCILLQGARGILLIEVSDILLIGVKGYIAHRSDGHIGD